EVAREKKVGSTTDSERGSKMVGDGEELFGNEGERLQTALLLFVIVIDVEFEDRFPTVIVK
ncbi:hypothetical protein A2U01_0105157, partial [Trifolium medium]|nr:hypothetical protein [Trifolium medium]